MDVAQADSSVAPSARPSGSSANAIVVIARFRPLNELEQAESADSLCVEFHEGSVVVETGAMGKCPFAFDRVFAPSASQRAVYERSARHLVAECFDGYNVTVLAYGQTGSGKTFTMQSIQNSVVNDMFKIIQNNPS